MPSNAQGLRARALTGDTVPIHLRRTIWRDDELSLSLGAAPRLTLPAR